MIPGEFQIQAGEIEINAGRATATVKVANSGDRPIQVGSHFHFYETNGALQFERETAYGMRLNIAAGTAVRFEPGQSRTVELVAYAGRRLKPSDIREFGKYKFPKGFKKERVLYNLHRAKEHQKDGTWRHLEIRLRPDSDDPKYKELVFGPEAAGNVRIIAELIAEL